MKKHYITGLVFTLLFAVAGATFMQRAVSAGDTPTSGAIIGQPIADFTLPDADGNKHSLASLKGKNGTVFIFIATRCPVSNGYNARMEKISQDYKARGVNVVGINSNSTEPADQVKAHAAENHLSFKVLKDEGSKVADQLGAAVTPEAYLLDAAGKLVYHGRIDNSRNGDAITSNDLRDAMDEVLAAKPVAKTGAKAFGCSIKRASAQ
ncbi:MAG: thioredoxin family protein [Pyrinomonadaceae bacterium]